MEKKKTYETYISDISHNSYNDKDKLDILYSANNTYKQYFSIRRKEKRCPKKVNKTFKNIRQNKYTVDQV